MTTGLNKNVRLALTRSDESGVIKVEYSTGMAIKRRSWGDEIAARHDNGRAWPKMTLRLNEQGVAAAEQLRYDDGLKRAKQDLVQLENKGALFNAAAEAHAELERLRGEGKLTGEQRGYIAGLESACRELVGDERAI